MWRNIIYDDVYLLTCCNKYEPAVRPRTIFIVEKVESKMKFGVVLVVLWVFAGAIPIKKEDEWKKSVYPSAERGNLNLEEYRRYLEEMIKNDPGV